MSTKIKHRPVKLTARQRRDLERARTATEIMRSGERSAAEAASWRDPIVVRLRRQGIPCWIIADELGISEAAIRKVARGAA